MFQWMLDDPFSDSASIRTPSGSLFKRILGKTPEKSTVRVTLNQKMIDDLMDGKTVTFQADGRTIEVVAPAKYDREYCDFMFTNRLISKVEYEIMLRQRA